MYRDMARPIVFLAAVALSIVLLCSSCTQSGTEVVQTTATPYSGTAGNNPAEGLVQIGGENGSADIQYVYWVQNGDTVQSLAARFGASTADICMLNGITLQTKLNPGDRIIIPQPGSAATSEGADISVPILMYHHVRDTADNADAIERGLTISPALFQEHASFLKSRGYSTVTIQDLVESRAGEKELPAKPVILTFDDGYADSYENVFPVLKSLSYTGSFFLLSGLAGAPGYMTWEQAKEMESQGMDIQAHGVQHLDLTAISEESAELQITRSKDDIELYVGNRVTIFCYPSGRYSADTVAMVRKAGYLAAVTTVSGEAMTTSHLYELPRIRVSSGMTLSALAEVLDEKQ